MKTHVMADKTANHKSFFHEAKLTDRCITDTVVMEYDLCELILCDVKVDFTEIWVAPKT